MSYAKKKCNQCNEVRKIPTNRKICQGCRTLNTRIYKGEVRLPDFDEVNVTNYKEPLEEVKDGYGYIGAIVQTNDGKHIQCHLCGYFYAALGAHIKNRHKMEARDYKVKFGLRLKDGLLSPTEKEKRQISYNRTARKTPEEFAEMSRKGKIAREAKGTKVGGNMWTAQTRNEKGVCKDQTLAKIRHVAELCGGTPVWGVYMSEYGGMDVVKHWFGSWQKAVEAAGIETYLQGRRRERRNKMKDIENMIRTFYTEEGRTPSTSDFNSVEYLPSQRTVTKLFGTLNKARASAGVPEILYFQGQWIEVDPGVEMDGVVPSAGRPKRLTEETV